MAIKKNDAQKQTQTARQENRTLLAKAKQLDWLPNNQNSQIGSFFSLFVVNQISFVFTL